MPGSHLQTGHRSRGQEIVSWSCAPYSAAFGTGWYLEGLQVKDPKWNRTLDHRPILVRHRGRHCDAVCSSFERFDHRGIAGFNHIASHFASTGDLVIIRVELLMQQDELLGLDVFVEVCIRCRTLCWYQFIDLMLGCQVGIRRKRQSLILCPCTD